MSSNLQDIYVVDESKPDLVMWVDSFLSLGDIGIVGISDMVEKVKSLAKNKKVRELRISGHGNVWGQYVGADWLSLDTLPKHRSDFLKLSSGCFGPGGIIILTGCEVGNNGGLLLALSDIVGVAVQAFTANQRPIAPGDEGGVTRCFITCTRTGPTASDTIDRILGQGSSERFR